MSRRLSSDTRMFVMSHCRCCAELNEFTIVFFICIGFYQALCNMWRVAHYDTRKLPIKVGSLG